MLKVIFPSAVRYVQSVVDLFLTNLSTLLHNIP